MKKLVATVCTLVLLGSTVAMAAVGFTGKKIANSKIVQGEAVVTYAGTTVAVPQGQTIILGQRENGSIVIRALNLNNVEVNGAKMSTRGYTVLSYQPNRDVAFLNRGELLTVSDRAGHTASVEQGGAISTVNAEVNSNTVEAMKEAAAKEAQEAAVELADEVAEVPAFVAATETTSAATEQAVQDVEETLSPSAPR